jgi:hypothetical protein
VLQRVPGFPSMELFLDALDKQKNVRNVVYKGFRFALIPLPSCSTQCYLSLYSVSLLIALNHSVDEVCYLSFLSKL